MLGRNLSAGLGAVLLLFCGACSQRWTFAPPGPIPPGPAHVAPRATVGAAPRHDVSSVASAGDVRFPLASGGAIERPCESPVVSAVFRDDPLPPACCAPDTRRCRLAVLGCRTRHEVLADHGHYYSWLTARNLLWGIAGGSVLANTSLDQNFRDWLQDDARSRQSDRLADFWRPFGDGAIFVPAFAGLGLAGMWLDDIPLGHAMGEFGTRTTRAYLVGTPAMVFMQYGLGGSRPGNRDHASFWRPFDSHSGVSGHAFIGAVPFITAANMSPNRCAKACWYFLSTLPAWSRLNDDTHYLSQVGLGWWMAYLACQSVDQTETATSRFALAPLAEPDAAGVMVVLRR